MDHRCPVCRADLGNRKLSQAVMTRMEIDCKHCKARIRLNVHAAEAALVVLDFAALVVLALLAYLYQSHALMMAALGAVMAGAIMLPLLEKTWLRSWPRYAKIASSPDA